MAHSFTEEETQEIVHAFLTREDLRCPRCRIPMDARPVPPRPDVSYVRDRLWLVCPGCRRSIVLDRREHT